jgi:hypothetical protein
MIGGEHIPHCTAAKAIEELNSRIDGDNPSPTADTGPGSTDATSEPAGQENILITQERADFIDEEEIEGILAAHMRPEPAKVRELLAKAREMRGLSMEEVACLSFVESPGVAGGDFRDGQADQGRNLRIAPGAVRAALHLQSLLERVHLLRLPRQQQGSQAPHAHAGGDCRRNAHSHPPGTQAGSDGSGEALPEQGFQYILDSIATIYATKVGPGEIRRVNVNLAPQNVERFRQLKDAGIGTFQLFQETYHRPTYAAGSPERAPSAITTGARLHSTGPWKRASTMSASACCSASTTGASRSSR